MSEGVDVIPHIRFPRYAERGAQYVATVDLEHGLDPHKWPYEQEEFAFRCVIEAGRAFTVKALDESVLLLHRRGDCQRAAWSNPRRGLEGLRVSPDDVDH